MADHVRKLFGIACRFTTQGAVPALEPTTVTQIYKIAQEAVTNTIKHGKAKKVAISLATGPEALVLKIQNNGLPDLRSKSTGMGLRIMNYRASLIGASLEVKAAGPRSGTVVTCAIPVEAKT